MIKFGLVCTAIFLIILACLFGPIILIFAGLLGLFVIPAFILTSNVTIKHN